MDFAGLLDRWIQLWKWLDLVFTSCCNILIFWQPWRAASLCPFGGLSQFPSVEALVKNGKNRTLQAVEFESGIGHQWHLWKWASYCASEVMLYVMMTRPWPSCYFYRYLCVNLFIDKYPPVFRFKSYSFGNGVCHATDVALRTFWIAFHYSCLVNKLACLLEVLSMKSLRFSPPNFDQLFFLLLNFVYFTFFSSWGGCYSVMASSKKKIIYKKRETLFVPLSCRK